MTRRKQDHPFIEASGLAIGFAWKLLSKPHREKRARIVLDKAIAATDEHSHQLVRRRAQLVRQDAYGKALTNKWEQEIDYFVMNHIAPRLSDSERIVLSTHHALIVRAVADRTEQMLRDGPVFAQFSDDLSPAEFEVYCAEQLRRAGWDARVTRQSRDQGVDVIGEKDGSRIVLQCKLYSTPVGNQAVQEIAAGKAHEQANWAAVVTNNRYTPSAEQLALSNGILLLHYSDLADLEAILQAKQSGGSPTRTGQQMGSGTQRSQPRLFCSRCGSSMVACERFCGGCGAATERTTKHA